MSNYFLSIPVESTVIVKSIVPVEFTVIVRFVVIIKSAVTAESTGCVRSSYRYDRSVCHLRKSVHQVF